MKPLRFTLLCTPILTLMLGCTQEETNRIDTFHFQGQDCLHCHNVDLKESLHLNLGATVYQQSGLDFESNITQEYCTVPLFVKLIQYDINRTVVLDTNKSNHITDPGFNGKGNIFSLSRKEDLPDGEYTIKITDANGTPMIDRISKLHKFSGTYDPDVPNDEENSYSCNACHSIAGSAFPLIVDANKNCMETK